MKKLYFVILFVFVGVVANAQSCWWLKGANGGSPGGAYGNSVTTDINGNVYAVGDFDGTSMKIGTTTLTNSNMGSNYGGMFVVKYSPGGTVKWAKGMQNGQNNGVATDKQGNVYVTGNYVTSIAIGTTTLSCPGGGIFLAKYDSLGNIKWVSGAGGKVSGQYDESKNVTVDNSGNPIITGDFRNSTIAFGTYTLTNQAVNTPDAFIAKYDSLGNVLWAHSANGTNYEQGFSVATDKSKNVYFSGVFDGDSLTVGNITIHKPAGGEIFIVKYDSSGNLIRIKHIHIGFYVQNGAVCQIATDTLANLFVSSEYAGTPLIIGNDTLGNPGGSTRIFIAKYDSSGNALWARGAVTTNYTNINRGLAIDKNGSPLITGYFLDGIITFGTSSLNNAHVNNPAIYITKYDANGVVQWAKTSASTGATVLGNGIAAGIGENVYVTGNYMGTTLAFGGASLSNFGTSDFFVADAYSFSSSITSYTNVSCNGGHNGAIIANASGGNMPYNYSWNFSPVHVADTAYLPNNDSLNNLPAGYYSVTITEGYGCAQMAGITLTEPPADSMHICMVTVDSASQHNIIIWDKTSYTNVDSFIIYREIATNNYQPIAAVSFNSLSQFIDTVRTKYFPNTGNPNAGTYRYKLKAHVTCGGYTGLSPFHNTIYILNSSGTFYWTQPYTIQGGANPVSSYVLMRDNLSNGTWQAVSSVAGTQQTVSDPLYTIYQSTASWRVQTNWSITCVPTLRVQNNTASNFSSSYSNIYTNNLTAVKNNLLENKINVYPTLSNGNFIVEVQELKNTKIEIYSVMGELVYQSELKKDKNEISLTLVKGTYILHVISDNVQSVRRIIIE